MFDLFLAFLLFVSMTEEVMYQNAALFESSLLHDIIISVDVVVVVAVIITNNARLASSSPPSSRSIRSDDGPMYQEPISIHFVTLV